MAARAAKAQDSRPLIITPMVLRRWPLPQPDEGGDKEERGRVLVVGGERETPGALILAATAALRAGAGKLRVVAGRSVAHVLAAAVPEARVFALPETNAGVIAAKAAPEIADLALSAQSVLVGPGMIDESSARLMRELLPHLGSATTILDAAALGCLKDSPGLLRRGLDARAVITPNADEMAELLGESLAAVKRDPLAAAKRGVKELRAVVVLKGEETFIAAPGGSRIYRNRAGNVGLATSGSGDVLAGVIAGLAARGATPLQAAVWGVYLHARAGEVLARRVGPLGYLARELAGEVPALMSELDGPKKS